MARAGKRIGGGPEIWLTALSIRRLQVSLDIQVKAYIEDDSEPVDLELFSPFGQADVVRMTQTHGPILGPRVQAAFDRDGIQYQSPTVLAFFVEQAFRRHLQATGRLAWPIVAYGCGDYQSD